MKKSRAFVFILRYGCLLLLGCLSCGEERYFIGNKGYTRSEVLAIEKQKNEEMLSQVMPTDAPVGDSLIVVIPTDDLLPEIFGLSNPEGYPDAVRKVFAFQLQVKKNELLANIEALRKRALFDTVQWRQSADPEQETFETDFALIRPLGKDSDWLLRSRSQDQAPVVAGPSSASRIQWTAIWLDHVEKAVGTLKQP